MVPCLSLRAELAGGKAKTTFIGPLKLPSPQLVNPKPLVDLTGAPIKFVRY